MILCLHSESGILLFKTLTFAIKKIKDFRMRYKGIYVISLFRLYKNRMYDNSDIDVPDKLNLT